MWLERRHVRGAAGLAARAMAAAGSQHVVLAGQDIAARIVAELADSVLTLDQLVKDLDTQLVATLEQHPQAAIIQSMPGFGPVLGATLLVVAGDYGPFPAPGTSLLPLDWCPSPTTPDGDQATFTSPVDTAGP